MLPSDYVASVHISVYLTRFLPVFAIFQGEQWEVQIRLFLQSGFMAADPHFSCSARCGMEQRNASPSFIPLCYCDKLCDDFGDCCFDFDEL